MRHDSTEPVWDQITGPTGWHLTATGVQVSINNGTTWVNATVATATATPLTLANGTAGTRCWISVLAPSLNPQPDTLVQFLVRLTNGADAPVMIAAGKFYFE